MASARMVVRRGLATVLLLAVVVACGLVVVLHTQWGSRWVLQQADGWLEAELKLSGVEGTLWRGVSVADLQYRDESVHIHAQKVTVQLNWRSSTSSQLNFRLFNAASLNYRSLVAPPAEPEPFTISMAPVPIAIGIEQGRIKALSLQETGVLSAIQNLDVQQLSLQGQRLTASHLAATATGYTARLERADIELAGRVPVSADIQWTDADQLWSGHGAIKGNLAEMQVNQQLEGPYPMQVAGIIRVLDQIEPTLDVQVQWHAWTFGEYAVHDGQADVAGVLDAYQASYRFQLSSPFSDDTRISGTASGSTEQLTQASARVEASQAVALLEGQVTWLPEFSARSEVQIESLDPALLSPTLSGNITGQLHIALDETETVALSDLALTGILNEAAFSANGELLVSPDGLDCRQCTVHSGDNTVVAKGRLNQTQLDMDVAIDAPDLADLWPELKGALVANGHLAGSPEIPQFAGRIQANELQWQEWQIQSLAMDSRSSSRNTLDLNLLADGLAYENSPLGVVTLQALGSPEQAHIELDWQGPEQQIVAAFELGLSEQRIIGQLSSASIVDAQTGTWALSAPATLDLDSNTQNAGPMLWLHSNGEMHIDRLSYGAAGLAIKARLQGLSLAAANPLLPEGYQLQGQASANVDVALIDGLWTGSADWLQTGTILQVLQADASWTDVRIPTAKLNAILANGGAQFEAGIAVEPGVTAHLTAELQALAADAPLQAELQLQGKDWDWLAVVVPAIDRIEGVVEANIRAEGAANAPGLQGQISWLQGRLIIPALNVPLTDIQMTLVGGADGSASLQGKALAGEGELSIEGQLSHLLQSQRSINLTLRGDTAEVINWPEYHVWGSPDLVIAGNANGWTINGDLGIPRAELSIMESAQDAVSVSTDVTIAGETTAATAETQYSGRVRLKLGDRVQVSAYGLDARLEGDLLVRMPRNRPMRAEGTITLIDGVFEAYGQKLAIESGTITFTGRLDNPLVDVKAVRRIESFSGPITAGIHLRGRALSLNSNVYSDPSMTEAEALSYLVLGQPLSQASSSEGSQLSGAALALGLRQATRITDQIGRNLGLDQLSVAADGSEGTALVAGKQINARLYARYAYGVFSRLGTLMLRYRLSKRLTLEAGTGETQSIDLLYTVEKK